MTAITASHLHRSAAYFKVPSLGIFVLFLGGFFLPAARAETPAEAPPDYTAILRALKPKMIIEITEANLNEYLRTEPEELTMPEGFENPYVALSDGNVEVSAVTKMLLVPTRVRVSMVPEVVAGRLQMRVRRLHAGPIRLPSRFHRGVGDTIARMVNDILDHNELQLTRVEVRRGLIRVTAEVQKPT